MLTACLIGLGVLLTHVQALASVRHWDDTVNGWLARHRTSELNRFSRYWSLLGDTVGVLVVAAAVGLILVVGRAGRWALLIVVGLPLELLTFLSVNYAVDRPRPGVPRLGSSPSTHSFPSGHIAAAIVLYGGIALLVAWSARRRVFVIVAAVAAVLVAAAVGWSRMYRGMHHPTDVVAGAVMGLCCLALARAALVIWSRGNRQAVASHSNLGAGDR